MKAEPNDSDRPAGPACGTSACACGPWWRLPLLLAVVLGAVALFNRYGVRQERPIEGTPPTAVPGGATVSMDIDFGDGSGPRRWEAVPWREGMTVADLLASAAADTLGDPLAIRQQGSGDSAFLTQINDAANEGADGRNWTYQVNGQHADRPFATYELQPGDAVLWRYGKAQ